MNIEHMLHILQEATARIAPEYLQLPVAGQENPIYRERVYCYEFYHQLRSLWPNDSRHSLCGEVDKGGHRLIRNNGLDNVKPDFLVHIPGDMGGNLLVIEVKPINTGKDGVEKDLQTLTAFRRHADYQRAIYLIYGGHALERARQIALSVAKRDRGKTIDLGAIDLWHHAAPGHPATPAGW